MNGYKFGVWVTESLHKTNDVWADIEGTLPLCSVGFHGQAFHFASIILQLDRRVSDKSWLPSPNCKCVRDHV